MGAMGAVGGVRVCAGDSVKLGEKSFVTSWKRTSTLRFLTNSVGRVHGLWGFRVF